MYIFSSWKSTGIIEYHEDKQIKGSEKHGKQLVEINELDKKIVLIFMIV